MKIYDKNRVVILYFTKRDIKYAADSNDNSIDDFKFMRSVLVPKGTINVK